MKNHIFGTRAVIEAIEAGKSIEKVLLKTNSKGELNSELLALLRQKNIFFQYVPIEKLNKINSGNHQGVIAIVSEIEYYNLEDVVINVFEQGRVPLLLILDNLTDVRNFGAIARTAECSGVDAVIIPSRNSVTVTPDAIKTSAGALNRIPVCKEENLTDTVILLQQMGIKVIATTEKASNLIYDEDLTQALAVIMGSEDKGVSNQLIKKADSLLKIPIYGSIDSLNVSVASGIVIYETIRQRLK
jgi:23S rRNA (guanosine2251-2'-O)-methyltransferase